MRNRRSVLLGVFGAASLSMAGCTISEDLSQLADETEGLGEAEDNEDDAPADGADDRDVEVETEALRARTENILSDIRWVNFRRGLAVAQYREPLADISEAAQQIIDSDAAVEPLGEIEETLAEWESDVSSRLFQMYPGLTQARETIPDIVADLDTAITAVSEPGMHPDVVAVAEQLVDRADYYRSTRFMSRFASTDPIANRTYNRLQSEEALAADTVTPVFEIRHSLDGDGDGDGGLYTAAHPHGDGFSSLSNGPFERTARTDAVDTPGEKVAPFSTVTDFEHEMTVVMGDYTGEDAFTDVTTVLLQVQEYDSPELAAEAVGDIIDAIDGDVRTRVDFDSGEEEETIDIVGLDWTLVEYSPERYGGRDWRVALKADEEYVYILDPYPADGDENEARWETLSLCWLSDEFTSAS